MVYLRRIALVFFLAGPLLVLACGGSDDSSKNKSTGSGHGAGPDVGPSPAAAAAPQIIEVKDVENGQVYSFDPNKITLKPGEVVIRYTNPTTGTRDHGFEVKTLDGNGDIFKSDLVSPGQTVELKFTLGDVGTYNFLCFQRGHADRGQTGTIVVSKS